MTAYGIFLNLANYRRCYNELGQRHASRLAHEQLIDLHVEHLQIGEGWFVLLETADHPAGTVLQVEDLVAVTA